MAIDREVRNGKMESGIFDTGEWRLTLAIGKEGLQGWLKHNADSSCEVKETVCAHWAPTDEGLLERIENTVYDNPGILDDFTADIVITTDKIIWIPQEYAGEYGDDICDTYIKKLWPEVEEREFFRDEVGNIVSVYMLCPGLKGFMQRTFPGTRIHNHLSVLARHLGNPDFDHPVIYINIRKKEADFLLFDKGRILNGSTHGWGEPTDIIWHCFNILDLCGIDPKETVLSLSGEESVKKQVTEECADLMGQTIETQLPEMPEGMNIPMAALLEIARGENSEKYHK